MRSEDKNSVVIELEDSEGFYTIEQSKDTKKLYLIMFGRSMRISRDRAKQISIIFSKFSETGEI